MEIFSQAFMVRAFIAGAFIGLSCALVGTFVVLKKMAFFSDSIAHGTLAGIAVALLAGLSPVVIAAVFSLLMALAITYIKQKMPLSIDTAIGISFSGAMALAVILISQIPGYQPDLMGYLFGSILAITKADVAIAVAVGVLASASTVLLRKSLLFISFDRDGARLSGINANIIECAFLCLLALTIVIGVRVVGAILVSALMVVPAAAARSVCRSFKQMMGLSALFGLLSTFFGLVLSYYVNAPSGAVIVMVALGIFVAAFVAKTLQRP